MYTADEKNMNFEISEGKVFLTEFIPSNSYAEALTTQCDYNWRQSL